MSMDTLVQIYSTSMNRYIYNPYSIPAPLNPNNVNGCSNNGYSPDQIHINDPAPTFDSSPSVVISESDVPKKPEYLDTVLKYLNQMLMEEDDLQTKPCMLNECLALQVQAAEKCLFDVLVDKSPTESTDQENCTFARNQNGYESPPNNSAGSRSSEESGNNYATTLHPNYDEVKQLLMGSPENSSYQALGSSSNNDSQISSLLIRDRGKGTQFLQFNNYVNYRAETEEETTKVFPDGSRRKRNPYQEQEERDNKQFATYTEGLDLSETFDKVLLLCKREEKTNLEKHSASSRGRPKKGSKRKENIKEVVDLRNMLTQCAQAMTNSNITSVHEMLKKIRNHSSPHGDSNERLAHYFANAIEARLTGTGAELYGAFKIRRISAAQSIKAYDAYITACPFPMMSNLVANGSIRKLAMGKKKLHIIDFGILYGFQWPCFIHNLSARPGGPPKLRITGIDLPQPGFRPAERIEETGNRLANYCKRFNVPFEYNPIAKKWENIIIEDLKLESDEVVVVNCLYRLRYVHDETVVGSSPRDAVLNLIRRVKPDMFVHGVLNGTYNNPFLLTRFQEALFHFSTLFDMFDSTSPREDKDRLLFEQEVFARDAMNVLACESTSRIERPETYKQWQSRNIRARFRQLPLYPEAVKDVRTKVKLNYHKDFLVDEDGNWMLQGWKGKVLYAISLWKPAEE